MTGAPDDLPEGVHVLPLDVEFDGREITLHPSAVETERGLLLFDAGLPHTVGQLEDRLAAAGFDLTDVGTVLVTHQDGDHAGGLSAVVDAADPFVVAHERDAPVVDGRADPRGSGDGDRYEPVRVDLELAAGVTFRTRAGPAEVVPTPGHTPGHVSVYLPDERFLVAADALTASDDGLAGPRPDMTEDMETALASVARLAERDVTGVLCYHGGYVETDSDRLAGIGEG